MDVVLSGLPRLGAGLLVTLGLITLGFAGAMVIGTPLAVCRVGPVRPLRIAAAGYVGALRNIPLLTLFALLVFGLPDIGITLPLFVAAALGLALVGAAFVCEAVRGGIEAVPVGQVEAARALGLTFGQTLHHVVVPVALRTMVQPIVNVFIGIALGSSVAAAIGVEDLTKATQRLAIESAEAVVLFLVAGAVYVTIAACGAAVGGWLERRVRVR